MDFEQNFTEWLASCIGQGVPEDVRAFSFNLYEPAGEPGVVFGIELIGSGQFDENDPDWPCDEMWEPDPRGLNIPVAYSGEDWETCLQNLRALILKQLGAETPEARALKSSQGVGFGFVDGDLELLWKA